MTAAITPMDSDREHLLNLLGHTLIPLPPREQKVGASTVEWWEGKAGDAIVMAHGGSIDDRVVAEQVVVEALKAHGYKRAQFTFDHRRKTADWNDIMAKATRLVNAGNVTVLRNGYNSVAGHVIGDHGEYDVEIGRDDPDSRAITTWTCECPWDQYAWQRTRKWKKYEGRPCAHVMALYWSARQMPLDEDVSPNQPVEPGQKLPPSTQPPDQMGPGAASPPSQKPMSPMSPPHVPSPSGPGGFADATVGPPGPAQAPLQPPMAPPGAPNSLPPSPMQQLQMMQPAIPGQTPPGMPAPPNSVSVPGVRLPTPFNPVQFPGGTYSSAPEEPPNYRKGNEEKHCGGCKMFWMGKCWGYGNKDVQKDYVCDSFYPASKKSRVAAEQLQPGTPIRLKNTIFGQAEGRSEAHGAGQYREVAPQRPDGSYRRGEVLYHDPTTNFVEVAVPLEEESGPMEPNLVRCFVDPTDIEPVDMNSQDVWINRR